MLAKQTHVYAPTMAAVRSAICGAQHLLPSQRFKLWGEAAALTVLCRQLTVIVGEANVDRTRMLSKLLCRSCRSSLLSLVRLKLKSGLTSLGVNF